jgi:hypothetical protein
MWVCQMKNFKYNFFHLKIPEGWRIVKRGELLLTSDRYWDDVNGISNNWFVYTEHGTICSYDFPHHYSRGWESYIRKID